jgi:two-component system, NarL family, invasion response regulator UvrY
MIKVFIADDHTLIREGIKNLIGLETDIKLVGETSDPYSVIDTINKTKCDILILDISMPGKSGLDILKEIKIAQIDVKVLMMTMLPEEQFARRALKSGAAGYLTKDSASEEIITAIRKIANGRKYVSPSLAEKLAEALDESIEKEPHEILSDREFQILRLIAQGKSQTEIGEELAISTSTVNTYRSRILEKLNLHSNADIIHFAYKHKLIE